MMKPDAYRWLDDQGAAFGAPGLPPRWTSSRKDTVSTAYAASSRIWFTISHGILNEIYSPTIDQPQTRDMELLFTDGETFLHEEKRDLDYDFQYIEPNAPAARVTGHAPGGLYTVTKEFISNPHHPVVLMHVRVEGDEAILAKLKCYALLSPHLEGGGAENCARSVDVAGQRCLLAWKGNASLALGVTGGFSRSSCGFVGQSDGYQDLKGNNRMDWQFGQAMNGNIAVMGEIPCNERREFTVGIALGHGAHAAIANLIQTLAAPFAEHRDRFILQWGRTKLPPDLAQSSGDKGVLARISQNVVLTHEDKTYSGAFIASASIPWGASKGDDDLGGYHLVWTRDMVQSATAMIACGRAETALRALVYLACTQQTDGSFAQNFWIDGTPYWGGIQLDEVALPIILAWRLWKADALGDFDALPFVERAAGFLVRYAPVTQQERWEENAGYSPSTLAAVIASLVCAADLVRSGGNEVQAGYFETYADWIEANLDQWTTTTEGVLLPDVKYHYVRIRPPAEGQPFFNPDVPADHIHIANRAPDEKSEFEAREIVDAGFLELVRYGIRRADDPLIVDSLKVIDATLKIDTPAGPVWRRYNHDGYGQRKDGGPYEGWGQGRAWPLLTGERAHYELAAGRPVANLVRAFESSSSAGGMLPEQVWDQADLPAEGLCFGKSAGSAQPLVWTHSEYLKLLRSITDGRVFDRISVVEERYAVGREERTFISTIEIFQLARPVTSLIAGLTLRIVDRDRFQVLYTSDDWATQATLDSQSAGSAGYFADLATKPDQTGQVCFTLCWPQEGKPPRWLGHNLTLTINPRS